MGWPDDAGWKVISIEMIFDNPGQPADPGFSFPGCC